MTVSIDIDLNSRSAHVKLGALKAQLESLDEDLDIDLDLDGNLGDTLDDLSDTMDELSEAFNKDLNETIDRLEGLEFDDISIKDGNGDSGGDTGSDSGDLPANRANDSIYDKINILAQEVDLYTPDLQGNGLSSDGDFNGTGDSDRSTSDLQGNGLSSDEDFNGAGDSDLSTPGVSGNTNNRDDDGIDSDYLLDKIRKAAGLGSFSDSETGGNSGYTPMDEERRYKLQGMLDSVFTQDDFEFRIDRDASNREGELFGRSNAGLMSFGDYQRVRNIEGDMSFGGKSKKRRGKLGKIGKKFRSMKEGIDGMGRGLRNAIPNMQMWWSIIGAMIPVLGAMAVQALGVAAAMGSMAVAGAGIVGLGLIGHGDSMSESFRNAGEQIDELKKSLFDVIKPTAELFSQTQAEFFDFIPGEMRRVARSMEGLMVFEDDLFSMFRGLTQFISQFFEVITGNASIISQLSTRFGEIVGSSILDLFKGLLDEGYKNQEMLIRLGETFKILAISLYNVFVFVSQLLVVLKPLFKVFAYFSNLLKNSLVAGFSAFVTILFLSTYAAVSLTGAILSLQTALATGTIPLISTMISTMSAYVPTALSAAMANYALAESIATVIGVATLGTGIAIAGWAGLKAYQGMKQAKKINKNLENTGTVDSSLPGASGGSQTIVNEGDTVNVDLSNADRTTVEKFTDLGSDRDIGPTGGSYT